MPMKMFDKTFFYRRNTEYVYSPPQSNIQYEDDVQKHTQPPAYDLSQWLKPKHYCSTRNVIIFDTPLPRHDVKHKIEIVDGIEKIEEKIQESRLEVIEERKEEVVEVYVIKKESVDKVGQISSDEEKRELERIDSVQDTSQGPPTTWIHGGENNPSLDTLVVEKRSIQEIPIMTI